MTPKPLFRTKPVPPTRPKWRVFPLTIAAGILCSDGAILCADTEVSDDVRKFQAPKIFAIGDHTFLTGAGHSDYIAMAVDKLTDDLKVAVPQHASDARQVIETLVHGIYEEHIFGFYKGSDPYRPQMQLIVAMRCANGDLALVRTNDSIAILSKEWEVAGTGAPIFDYWCRYFYRDRLTMEGMAVLALFMLKEVKKAHPHCGGASHVYYLPRLAGGMPIRAGIFDEDHLLLGFPDNIVRILSACFFEDTPSAWIDAKLQEFVTGVQTIHQEEKIRKWRGASGLSTPSTPQTTEGQQ
jgi:20S proteasome alpha/beta subunit